MSGTRGAHTAGVVAARNAEIARLRARGLTWASIASEVGLGERQVRRGFADHIATLGDHSDLGESALHDLLENLDQQIENAVRVYERTETRNRAVAIAAVRTALRGLTTKANVLAAAGIIGVDGAKWQRDRAAFRAFVIVGIDLLLGVERGEIDAREARERFATALGLLDVVSRGEETLDLNATQLTRPR